MALWAFEEPKRTPSGTMQAHWPPFLRRRRKSARKRSSVFLVLVTALRLPAILPSSMLPLKGGLARHIVYLSFSVFCLETLSL